jgi:secreted PhoX family phosphatase
MTMDGINMVDGEEIDARAKLEARRRDERDTFEYLMDKALARRAIVKSVAAGAAAGTVFSGMPFVAGDAEAQTADFRLTFSSIGETRADAITVPPGYGSNVIIRWGDPLRPGLAAFDPDTMNAADQAQRFGFNCDMLEVFPIYVRGRRDAVSYLMAVNHEYTSGSNMFTNYTRSVPQAQVEIEAHGVSIVQIHLVGNEWVYDVNSGFNRRMTGSSPMLLTGPAAGYSLLQTPADPTGRNVRGTLNNCAGGKTPWGTYLTAEENFDQYFANTALVTNPSLRALNALYPFMATGASGRRFENADPRFNTAIAAGEREALRFGWIVEIDPYDPNYTPRKRTALGRFKHEGAQTVIAPDDRVVVYSGDDERFDYIYKFVTAGRFNPNDRAANMNLLDSGELYVARLNEDGTGEWLPVSINNPVLQQSGRFANQAEVLINTRLAGDILGATPMDRPEDVEAPHDANFRGNGRFYALLTNNNQRQAASSSATDARGRALGANAANPRPVNVAGHIVEFIEDGNNATALRFRWNIFLLAGDPANPASPNPNSGAAQNVDVRLGGTPTFTGARFGAPDNCAFDGGFNMWIATDGNPNVFPCNDSILATGTSGPDRGIVKRFMVGPAGCEICGPLMAPDNRTFFAAIQHPGENAPGLRTNAQSKWPNGDFPRPSVVAIRRTDGGRVGS